MRAHPYADRFPMLGAEELDRLAADIAENGLRNPIVLDTDGRILDGRNRWAACEIAGVKPDTVLFDGDDEAAFVLSVNVARRHLTTGQQAMSTALVLVDAGKRENGRWAYRAVEGTFTESGKSTWRNALNQAGTILDHAADLAEQVVEGALALDAAYREAEKRRDSERSLLEEQERIAAEDEAYREHLEQVAPEYLAQYKTARIAFAAWESENEKAAANERRAKAEREAAEARRRKDLSHTFTRIFETFMAVGSNTAPIEKIMAEFHPSLLHPPKLARYGEVEHIEKGIKFLTDYIEWKKAQSA